MVHSEKIILSLGLILLAFGCKHKPVVPECTSAQTDKPNVVLIMVDDLGQECLESYGGQSYATPNLNRLASEGLQFENAYATYNCHTTRAQIMTGQYPFKNGWTRFEANGRCFNSSKYNLGRMFKNAGYTTGIVGKWHLCLPQTDPNNVLDCGFDRSLVWVWKMDGESTSRFWKPVLWDQDQVVYSNDPNEYGPDTFTHEAKRFMSANCETPFFLYYPMVLVHSPFTDTPDQGRPLTEQDDPARFKFMVEYMDKLVGELMEHLDATGLSNNTLLIFTGDNGTDELIYSIANGRNIQGGKNSMLESGVNMPLIARWPGEIQPGTTTDELVDFTDILPTLADIVDSDAPVAAEIQGVSFQDVLKGGVSNRDWIYSQFSNKWVIKDKRWKLTYENQLFDLENDPYEEDPIWPAEDDAETSAIRSTLQNYYDELVD